MYISELIKLEDIKKWKKGNNILIDAQTGSGKSTFVMKTLNEYYSQLNQKILMFSNRNLLKKQNKEISNNSITCLNYQYVEKLGDGIPTFLANYDIIIFDECHYFFSDSNFNKNTSLILDYAINSTNQIKIFSSATPEPLYKTNIKFDFIYKAPRDYKYIEKIIFFDAIEDIIKDLKQSEYKTIYFCTNLEDANQYSNKIKNSSFICSESNTYWFLANKKEIESILTKSCFNKHILFTTAVLDSGVNIIDPKLKNIVIEHTDPISIIQTLGRKRVANPEDKVTLYLKRPKKVQLTGLLNRKDNGENQMRTVYMGYIQDYYDEIKKIGFEGYWTSYFKFNLEQVDVESKVSKIRQCLKKKKDCEISKEELVKLFSTVLNVSESTKITSYNNFLEKTNVPYRIKNVRYYVTRKCKKTKWVIKRV